MVASCKREPPPEADAGATPAVQRPAPVYGGPPSTAAQKLLEMTDELERAQKADAGSRDR